MFATNRRQDGVTLMETFVSLALMALLTVWSAPSFYRTFTNSLVNSERQALAEEALRQNLYRLIL